MCPTVKQLIDLRIIFLIGNCVIDYVHAKKKLIGLYQYRY